MRNWIDDYDTNDISVYEFGKGGLVEFYLHKQMGDWDCTMSHHINVLALWNDVEDLGERLIGEARVNYSAIL